MSQVKCSIVEFQSAAFTLGNEEALSQILTNTYNCTEDTKKIHEPILQQLTNLWNLLGQVPTVYSSNSVIQTRCLANKLQKALGNPQSSGNSILLLMDRGMDLITPLIHDFTFQV